MKRQRTLYLLEAHRTMHAQRLFLGNSSLCCCHIVFISSFIYHFVDHVPRAFMLYHRAYAIVCYHCLLKSQCSYRSAMWWWFRLEQHFHAVESAGAQ